MDAKLEDEDDGIEIEERLRKGNGICTRNIDFNCRHLVFSGQDVAPPLFTYC